MIFRASTTRDRDLSFTEDHSCDRARRWAERWSQNRSRYCTTLLTAARSSFRYGCVCKIPRYRNNLCRSFKDAAMCQLAADRQPSPNSHRAECHRNRLRLTKARLTKSTVYHTEIPSETHRFPCAVQKTFVHFVGRFGRTIMKRS